MKREQRTPRYRREAAPQRECERCAKKRIIMKKMKILFCLLLVLEILFFAILCSTPFHDDWALARAIANYARNPTPETNAIRERESARVRRTIMIEDIVFIAIFAANTVALYRTGKKLREDAQQRRPC